MSAGKVDPALCRRLAAEARGLSEVERAQLTAAAELAERPALTADEVRTEVADAIMSDSEVVCDIKLQAKAWNRANRIAARVAEKLAGRQLAAAFDSASRAITGQSAADLNARLDIEQRAYPSPGFDTSDVVPVESIGNWDTPEQTTTPAPLKTMAELQSDGGERPRVIETDPSRSE